MRQSEQGDVNIDERYEHPRKIGAEDLQYDRSGFEYTALLLKKCNCLFFSPLIIMELQHYQSIKGKQNKVHERKGQLPLFSASQRVLFGSGSSDQILICFDFPSVCENQKQSENASFCQLSPFPRPPILQANPQQLHFPLYNTITSAIIWIFAIIFIIIMYRHLSPKVGAKDKQEELIKLKQTISGTTPLHFPQAIQKKDVNERPIVKKEKQPKNLETLLSNKSANVNSSANQLNSNKRIELKKSNSKNGSVFDDYYEKKPKPQGKDKKQQISLSGDSYQSEGFSGLKKKHNSPNSPTNKMPLPIKNMVTAPMINNQENRGAFKSPGNRPQNKNDSDDEKTGKRILSFGGKKLMAGRFLEDGDAYSKKSGENPLHNYPGSPTIHAKNTKFQGLDVSDQKSKKEINKQNTSNEIKGKDAKSTKNVPKFIANAKSSPYLPKKLSLDSSNELSGERAIKKIMANEHTRDKQKSKEEEQKSMSFNRGEMFLNLKKRQEQHSLLCKEMNILGVVIQLKLFSQQGEKTMKFTLLRKISESKKTGIFLGYHQQTSFLYCLKRTPISQMKKNPQEFIQQHKIQQNCSHPHLVKSFCSAYDAQYLYLVMEFMEAETLGHELKTELLKNMSEQSAAKAKINESVTTQISKINKVRKILFQIAGGVAFLHEKSIVHRDIKPDNVFISHDTYKLGDFGSAAKVGSLEYVGTLDYASPEILSQIPYDEKIDIWSLGCIAYELDVGRPPFFHINPEQTKRLSINGDYDKSLISDNELRTLTEKMLQVNKKQRISAKQLLKNEFFHDLQEKNTFF